MHAYIYEIEVRVTLIISKPHVHIILSTMIKLVVAVSLLLLVPQPTRGANSVLTELQAPWLSVPIALEAR